MSVLDSILARLHFRFVLFLVLKLAILGIPNAMDYGLLSHSVIYPCHRSMLMLRDCPLPTDACVIESIDCCKALTATFHDDVDGAELLRWVCQ